MLKEDILMIHKNWKQPRYTLTGDWIKYGMLINGSVNGMIIEEKLARVNHSVRSTVSQA